VRLCKTLQNTTERGEIMALTRAPEGSSELDDIKAALLKLAEKEAKVVFKVLQLHPEEQLENGPVQPVTFDMIVCSGPHKGKVLLDFRTNWKGITGPLRRAKAQGNDEVAARMELKKTGKTPWAAAQTPNDDDFELIENFYGDGKSVWRNAAPLVEPAEDAPASNGLARVGASNDSEAPPF
jgi:hypothetical protein